jgi:hypothetical protein
MVVVYQGRYTALYEEPFVVFMVGLRVNRWWAIHHWLPAFRSLFRIRNRLKNKSPEGFLGTHTWYTWREAMVVQYWQSFELLEQFARDNDDLHRPNWKWFVKNLERKGHVGVWHEAFDVDSRQYECIYTNMQAMGLAVATKHAPAGGKRQLVEWRKGNLNKK